MKKILLLTVITFVLSAMETKNKLVLHLDVNRTIIALDKKQGKNPKEFCNAALTEYTFHEWDGSHKKSFYDYAIEQVAHENPILAQDKAGDAFKDEKNKFLLNFPGYLKQNFPQLYQQYRDELAQMLAITGTDKLKPYPSLFPLLDYLTKRSNYNLILRTFGSDGQEVVDIIERERPEIEFNVTGKFCGPALHLEDEYEESVILEKPEDLYHAFIDHPFLADSENHMLVQDDYNHWKEKGKFKKHGKIFPIDRTDQTVVSLFADDNAGERKRTGRAILHPQTATGAPVDEDELIQSGNIIPVNRKQAVLDTQYFVNIIKRMDS